MLPVQIADMYIVDSKVNQSKEVLIQPVTTVRLLAVCSFINNQNEAKIMASVI
jgi:hypothetical protein